MSSFSVNRSASNVSDTSVAAAVAGLNRSPSSAHLLGAAPVRFDVEIAVGKPIQAVLDSCAKGAKLLLKPGLHVSAETVVIGKDRDVHIYGQGRASIEVTGPGPVVDIRAARATLDGVTLRHAPGGDDIVLYVPDACTGELVIKDVDVASDSKKNWGAYLGDHAVVALIGCRVHHCAWKALYVGGRVGLEFCRVHDNAGVGMHVGAVARPTLLGNVFTENAGGDVEDVRAEAAKRDFPADPSATAPAIAVPVYKLPEGAEHARANAALTAMSESRPTPVKQTEEFEL